MERNTRVSMKKERNKAKENILGQMESILRGILIMENSMAKENIYGNIYISIVYVGTMVDNMKEIISMA